MQTMKMSGRRALLTILLAFVSLSSIVLSGQTPPKFENFTATTTNLSVGNGESLKFNVLAWTAAPEREKFVAALQKGEEQLLEALKSAPSQGYIWTAESMGYTLRYAHRMPLANGGERIILASDRPLGAWSRTAWKAAGSTSEKATQLVVIELRLNRQGRGEGKMSLGANVGVDQQGGTIAVDSYDAAPVLLKDVTRVTTPNTN